MTIALVCVGKLHELYWKKAADEYTKRLRRFGVLEIIECPDLAEPKKPSGAEISKILRQECHSIHSQIKPRDYVIALCIGGKAMDSIAFSKRVSALEGSGVPRTVFVIGGSNGLSPEVLQRAREFLSFSPMTFPHQLARVMLLEQIYRARKLLANETYHK